MPLTIDRPATIAPSTPSPLTPSVTSIDIEGPRSTGSSPVTVFEGQGPLLKMGYGTETPNAAAAGAAEAAEASGTSSVKKMALKEIVGHVKDQDKRFGVELAKLGEETLSRFSKGEITFAELGKALTEGPLKAAGGAWAGLRELAELNGVGGVAAGAEKVAGTLGSAATSAPAVAAFEAFKKTISGALGKLGETGAGKAGLTQLEALAPKIAAAAPEIAGKLAPALGVLGKLAKFAGPLGILFALPRITGHLDKFLQTGDMKSLMEAGVEIGSLAPPPVGVACAVADIATSVLT